MQDIDIQEMFKEKNREIIRNNLKLDIERNIEVMVNSITNIFSKNFEEALKNITLMYDDSLVENNKKFVDGKLLKLKEEVFKLLNNEISNKKNTLNNKIDNLLFENDLNDYYDLVFETTGNINLLFKSDEIYNLKKLIIKDFDEFTTKNINDNSSGIVKSRINDYINYRLLGKIEEKVKEELIVRDNNLINMGRESYNRFQEISSMTTNKN